MSSIFGVVKTVHPPTSVNSCCSCRFFSDKEENLVTAGANWLHIYRIVSEEEKGSDGAEVKPKLRCAASYQMFGNIVSVSAVRLPWNERDVLLLTFRDAKLSVVEYDPRVHDLVTLSLHYFEEDALKSGLLSNYSKPMVRVDTDLRCAAMLVYGCQLVILPLRKDSASDETHTRLAASGLGGTREVAELRFHTCKWKTASN